MALRTPTEIPNCVVCSEPVEPDFQAWCLQCSSIYHLQQRQDRPGKDCGDVWISEESMSLEFRCQSCIDGDNVEEGSLDDVLDLEEAALAARMSPSQMLELAAKGQVKHRKTAGGVFLFMRRDVVHLREN